jgi:hypothetical protein
MIELTVYVLAALFVMAVGQSESIIGGPLLNNFTYNKFNVPAVTKSDCVKTKNPNFSVRLNDSPCAVQVTGYPWWNPNGLTTIGWVGFSEFGQVSLCYYGEFNWTLYVGGGNCTYQYSMYRE